MVSEDRTDSCVDSLLRTGLLFHLTYSCKQEGRETMATNPDFLSPCGLSCGVVLLVCLMERPKKVVWRNWKNLWSTEPPCAPALRFLRSVATKARLLSPCRRKRWLWPLPESWRSHYQDQPLWQEEFEKRRDMARLEISVEGQNGGTKTKLGG